MYRSTNGTNGWFCQEGNISDMLHQVCLKCLETREPDEVLSIESHFKNTILIADGCGMDFNVGQELTLNRARWSRLIKEYLTEFNVRRFIRQCREIINYDARDGATTEMRFSEPVRSPKKHRWGGCLLAASFHGNWDGQPTLTFYSRTTYIGYIGMLDAAIAHVLAREITKEFEDTDESSIKFIWHISSMQFHHFKTLPYLFTRPVLFDRIKQKNLITEYPALEHTKKWYQRVLRDYKQHGEGMLDVEKYGPFKRVKRRYLEHIKVLKHHLPASLPVSELDFSKASS